MRAIKFTKHQRLEILVKQDAGSSVNDVSREYQVSAATLHKWKKDKAVEADDTLPQGAKSDVPL
ncbi:MAG: transposase [Saprospiraceae bacterium]